MNQLSGAEAFVRMLQLHGVTSSSACAATPACRSTTRSAASTTASRHILTRDERSRRLHGRRLCPGHRQGRRVRRALAAAARPTSCRAWSRRTNPRSRCSRSPPTSRSASRGRFTLTELDQGALFRPLTKWNAVHRPRRRHPARVPRGAFEADDHRPPGRGAHRLPFDVQNDPVDERAMSGPIRRSALSRAGATAPDPAAVGLAAKRYCDAPKARCSSAAAGWSSPAPRRSWRARRDCWRAGRHHDQRQGLDRRAHPLGARRGRLATAARPRRARWSMRRTWSCSSAAAPAR